MSAPSYAQPVFVVVSGLPATGKTTLAAELSRRLGISLLDKDTILEALYDGCEEIDKQTRQRLSRSSDLVLERLAKAASSALLVSHWRHPLLRDSQSGTPTDWLATLPGCLVEIHIACPVDVAMRRFRERTRHPGHLDGLRAEEDLRRQFTQLSALGALKIGAWVVVAGDEALDIDAIAGDVRALLSATR
jgi:thymidylate kinase